MSNGLPIGLQIIGRHFQETTVLRAAYAFEQRLLVHEVARTLDEIEQRVEHLRLQRNRLSIDAEQEPAHRVQAKPVESIGDLDGDPMSQSACEKVVGELDTLGYSGFVGCEYRPAQGTLQGLGWMTACLR